MTNGAVSIQNISYCMTWCSHLKVSQILPMMVSIATALVLVTTMW